jgi:hypothetical protein
MVGPADEFRTLGRPVFPEFVSLGTQFRQSHPFEILKEWRTRPARIRISASVKGLRLPGRHYADVVSRSIRAELSEVEQDLVSHMEQG